MKKSVIALLSTILAMFGYVAVDRATDDRLSDLESQLSSQQVVIASLENNQGVNYNIGDIIKCQNFNGPFEWVHQNGVITKIDDIKIVVEDKISFEEFLTSTTEHEHYGSVPTSYRYTTTKRMTTTKSAGTTVPTTESPSSYYYSSSAYDPNIGTTNQNYISVDNYEEDVVIVTTTAAPTITETTTAAPTITKTTAAATASTTLLPEVPISDTNSEVAVTGTTIAAEPNCTHLYTGISKSFYPGYNIRVTLSGKTDKRYAGKTVDISFCDNNHRIGSVSSIINNDGSFACTGAMLLCDNNVYIECISINAEDRFDDGCAYYIF